MATKLDNGRSRIDDHYDDVLDNSNAKRLSDAENSSFSDSVDNYDKDADSRDEDAAIERTKNAAEDVGEKEDNTSGAWMNNYTGKNAVKKISKFGVRKAGGATGIIVAVLIGLAGIVSFFGLPGLILVQIAEIATDKFDSQVASKENRKLKILKAKLDVTTNGNCAGPITILCKYSSFSKHDIDRFAVSNIEVIGDKKTIAGRTKGTALKFTNPTTGKVSTITAKEFDSARTNVPGFNDALIQSYNTKFISKHDRIARVSLAKSKTSFADPFNDTTDTDEERSKTVLETTREGQSMDTRTVYTETADCEAKCTAERNRLVGDIEQTARDGIKSASPSGVKSVIGAVSVVGAAGDMCTVPLLISAIGTGAKIIRSQQLIRYSIFFLTTASMIKAGTAEAGDVSFLATILTKTVRNEDGSFTKAATDSLSYRHAAYNDTGSTNSSTLFQVGGGVGGDLNGFATEMYNLIPGGKSTCETLMNPWVQVGGLVVTLIPGFGQALKGGSLATNVAAKALVRLIAIQAGQEITMNAILMYLTKLATDMVAGVAVDANTFGEQAGDALVTGVAEFLTQTSGLGGNLVLNPEQAVGYNQEHESVLASYNAYEQATLSPFDTSSNATFLGSITSQFVPYFANMTSSFGALSSVAAIPLSTFSNFMQPSTASALGPESYKLCEDYEYREFNVATTPMCNVLRGIPAKYLALDPVVLTREFIASGDIDEMTGSPKSSAYKDFVTKCFSAEPVKDTGCMFTGPDADQRGRFAVHYIDQRMVDIMENSDPAPGTPTTAPVGAASCSAANVAPPQDYTKQSYKNKPFDVRTVVMIKTAEDCAKLDGLKKELVYTQGSYSGGAVAASGSSHNGGGAADISVRGLNNSEIDKVVKAFRQAGFAAWYRDGSEGFTPHIHVMAIGTSGAGAVGSPAQITNYFQGLSGLSSNAADRHLQTIGRPIPTWAEAYGTRYVPGVST